MGASTAAARHYPVWPATSIKSDELFKLIAYIVYFISVLSEGLDYLSVCGPFSRVEKSSQRNYKVACCAEVHSFVLRCVCVLQNQWRVCKSMPHYMHIYLAVVISSFLSSALFFAVSFFPFYLVLFYLIFSFFFLI